MKPPRPTEGVTRHCWGKRRRIAKKNEKGLWKAMARLGLLQKQGESTDSCSWDEECRGKFGRIRIPRIGWSGPDYCGEYDEWLVVTIARNHLDAPIWKAYDYDAMDGRLPTPIVKSDRHALQLLRKEIRDRKRRATSGKEG